MSLAIGIQALLERNFDDDVALTGCSRDGGCFCSLWHQRWTSSDDWKACLRDAPDLNHECVRERLRSGFPSAAGPLHRSCAWAVAPGTRSNPPPTNAVSIAPSPTRRSAFALVRSTSSTP